MKAIDDAIAELGGPEEVGMTLWTVAIAAEPIAHYKLVEIVVDNASTNCRKYRKVVLDAIQTLREAELIVESGGPDKYIVAPRFHAALEAFGGIYVEE